jgi:cytochrome d ubiquinol oxidase subunit II
MTEPGDLLPMILGGVIAFSVFAYVVLDGFDLGIGILFPLFPEKQQRDALMDSIAPVWDGNETWLVMGGACLFAAFPLAYAILLPALYAPLIALLLGLIFRGVAFEFRIHSRGRARLWELGFMAGSLAATLCQGIALGTVLQGVAVADRHYAGGWWDWLSPFSLLCATALVAGYALLGAGWLILKTKDAVRERAFAAARIAAIATLGFIAAVSLATPFLEEDYWRRWFAWPHLLYTAPVPLAVAAVALLLFRALARRNERQPFLLALVLFLLCFVGLGISVWPNIVPARLSLWEAAAPESSLGFLLVGVAILIPVILAYTIHTYWVFRGKVDAETGYH